MRHVFVSTVVSLSRLYSRNLFPSYHNLLYSLLVFQFLQYVVSDLGELGENTIIMFEEGVGAEEIVSSDDYVTYTMPSNADQDLVGALAYSETPYQHTIIEANSNKLDMRDCMGNIGAIDCKEEIVEEAPSGIVQGGEIHYEIKKELLTNEFQSSSAQVFYSVGAPGGSGSQQLNLKVIKKYNQ